MEKKQIDEALEIALQAERDEERLSIIAESGDEPEAVKAEEELAAGVEKSDDGFDVPTINPSKGEEGKPEATTVVGELFRTVPARVLRNEMQMAFLDARLVAHNTFDHVTEGDETSGMKGRLKKDLDFNEYVELVTKLGITLAIARFTSLGIRG